MSTVALIRAVMARQLYCTVTAGRYLEFALDTASNLLCCPPLVREIAAIMLLERVSGQVAAQQHLSLDSGHPWPWFASHAR